MKVKPNAEMEWSDGIVYTEAGLTRTMAPRPKYTMDEIPLPGEYPDLSGYYKNIVGVIQGKDGLIAKPEKALRVIKFIDLMFKDERESVSQKCEI